MHDLNRRRFLYATAGFAPAALLSASVWRYRRNQRSEFASGAAGPVLSSHNRTSWALGSDVSITVLHSDENIAQAGLDAAFHELELVEQLMSIYRADSQLSQLNRNGFLEGPPPSFLKVLRVARDMSIRSGGAFDITVQPLWEVFDAAKKENRLPNQDEISLAREHVDWRNVEISERRIALKDKCKAITLNGIAQGYALDRALEALRCHGVRSALVDTGELGSSGRNRNGKAWTAGIQHPRRDDAYVAVTHLDGRCLATSGDYATKFNNDYSSHHLFDPRSGRAANRFSSVSILAPTAMEADALSTAVFVMGRDDGVELIRSLPHVDALLVMKDGTVRATEGFPVVSA